MTRILMLLTKLLNINSTGVFLFKGTITSNKFVCQSEFLSFLKSVFRIQIHWIQIRIQKFCWVRILILAIAESGSKQRFLITFFIPNLHIFFLLQRTFKLWETLQIKREHFKHEISFIFSFFWDNFGLPGSRFRPGSAQIIRIRNTCLRALTALKCCKIILVDPDLISQIKYTCIYLKCLFNGKDILTQQAWKYNKILVYRIIWEQLMPGCFYRISIPKCMQIVKVGKLTFISFMNRFIKYSPFQSYMTGIKETGIIMFVK
jgi:hypothetical protein